jgi:hypothetical protein
VDRHLLETGAGEGGGVGGDLQPVVGQRDRRGDGSRRREGDEGEENFLNWV